MKTRPITEAPPFRNTFLFVTGRTPQVITETLFFFVVQHNPPLIPHQIHVITTTTGRELLLHQLLTPRTGRFYQFCREYGLSTKDIQFSADTVKVIVDAAGNPLADIRTDADNRAAADLITAEVRALTSYPQTRLLASMAGGRKTMGLYLGLALQLYGRPQDRLMHVLIDPPELENHPEFYYPPAGKRSHKRTLGLTATVTVAEAPLVLLGHKLPVLRDRAALSYGALVAQSQQEVNLLTIAAPLTLDHMRRQLCIGETYIPLSGLEFALYVLVAEKKIQAPCASACPGCEACTVQIGDFLDLKTIARLEQIAAEGGARDPRLRQLRWWAQEGEEGKKRFLQVCARIKQKIRAVLGDAYRLYVIAPLQDRQQRAARYTIPLSKALVRGVEPATLPPR
jgi:CRISPR-associated protein (TIGR02584 family)